jgi:hypothetical protein
VSVDDAIDAIAREALAEARRKEEAERYRNNPERSAPSKTPEGTAPNGVRGEARSAE